MKLYKQLIVLPVIAFSFIACMQGNKSEKATRSSSNNEATTGIIIEDTTLSKIVKKQMQNGNLLTDNQYYILREKGTERPFQNEFNSNHEKASILCRLQAALFSQKQNLIGTGWPSLCLINKTE
jgi:peptide-methionine (R)-S-oxide reductase